MIDIFLDKTLIKSPKSRIDEGINYILLNFKQDNFLFHKIFEIFTFLENDKFSLENIELFYLLIEFSLFSNKTFLDNYHFLNNYFKETNLYKIYDESTIYFIFMKKQIYIYNTFKSKKEILKKINISNIEKIFELQNFDFFKYPNFFSKNISPEEKKNIILEEYHLHLQKCRKYVFLIFWIIENDINYNILDKDIDEFEDFKIIDKISDIFLEKELLEVKIQEIDSLQKKHKVIQNYKLFKEFLFSVYS